MYLGQSHLTPSLPLERTLKISYCELTPPPSGYNDHSLTQRLQKSPRECILLLLWLSSAQSMPLQVLSLYCYLHCGISQPIIFLQKLSNYFRKIFPSPQFPYYFLFHIKKKKKKKKNTPKTRN